MAFYLDPKTGEVMTYQQLLKKLSNQASRINALLVQVSDLKRENWELRYTFWYRVKYRMNKMRSILRYVRREYIE